MTTNRMFLPGVWLLDILGIKKVTTLLVLCILVKKSFAFPLIYGLGYVKGMRNKHKAFFSIY